MAFLLSFLVSNEFSIISEVQYGFFKIEAHCSSASFTNKLSFDIKGASREDLESVVADEPSGAILG